MRRRIIMVVAVLLLVALVGQVYEIVQLKRMENECTTSRRLTKANGVHFDGWTWSPLGFTCTYSDGYSETKLWW